MATRQGWGLPWRREAQYPEPALGEGCSRWVRGRTGVPRGARGAKASARGMGKPFCCKGCPGPQCLEGMGRRGLVGSRPCAWPCCAHRHRHLQLLLGSLSGTQCQCLCAQSQAVTSSAARAVSRETSWLFAARGVNQASLHASGMSVDPKYLVTLHGHHYPALGNSSAGSGWDAWLDSAPKSLCVWRAFAPCDQGGHRAGPSSGLGVQKV